MAMDPAPSDWMTVIGVVSDVVQDGAMARHSTIYMPYLQSAFPDLMSHMTFVVRAGAGVTVAPAMRAALHGVDAAVPAQLLQSMDDALLGVVAEPLFQTRLLAAFSFLAVLLAAIGTYGVLACDVAERTREIALRMALGARPADVITMVMWRTGRLAAVGAALGLAAALALTHVLTSSLYEVKANDPATMAVVAAVVVAVALLAGFAPARRAARVEVLRALALE
jgi:putative ABC transport system permease protein